MQSKCFSFSCGEFNYWLFVQREFLIGSPFSYEIFAISTDLHFRFSLIKIGLSLLNVGYRFPFGLSQSSRTFI